MEISDLPNKELKVMITKMRTKIRRIRQEQSEKFNKDTGNTSTKQKSQYKRIHYSEKFNRRVQYQLDQAE